MFLGWTREDNTIIIVDPKVLEIQLPYTENYNIVNKKISVAIKANPDTLKPSNPDTLKP